MVDDDVLLGEVIVRSSALPGETVARALAEVAKRRKQGQKAELLSVLVETNLLDESLVEHLKREAQALAGGRDEELTKTLKLAYDSADPDAIRPRGKTGRFAPPPAAPVVKRPTGRLGPPPPALGPVPILPKPGSNVPTTPSGRVVGQTWGSYEVLNEVARGAMGAIYRARDKRRGGQEVALKVLLQGSAAEAEDLERFKREAHALQKLNHPGIVRFYEYGVHEGCPYVTMDFVAGTTLESIVEGGGLSIDKGLVILEQVARAVDHAHSRGVVHRDLKPANVLIGNDNLARVTDFGLARILEEGARLTRSGDLIGTPLYMSPEQIRGDLTALGPSSDVWSLGVTLYLLLTGEQPFGAKTIEQVAKRVKNEDPVPPSKVRPERSIHEDLERICLAALTKDPKLRYQSAGEFANDLRAYLHGKPVLAGRVTVGVRLHRFYRRLRLRPLRVFGAIAIVLAASGAATGLGHRSAPPDEARSAALAALAKLRGEVENLSRETLPPREAESAFVAAVDRVPELDDAQLSGQRAALAALGHRELARHAPADEDADHWAARQLLIASSLAPAGTSSIDARMLLDEALGPLRRAADPSFRPLVLQAVSKTNPARFPLVCARAYSLIGDWSGAEATLAPALESLSGPERDAALRLTIEADLAREAFETAATLAASARADAKGAERSALALLEARALRDLPRTDDRTRQRAQLLAEIEPGALDAALRQTLELESAALLIDTGKPSAALEHLKRADPSEPRTVVARATARLLLGDATGAAREVSTLDSLLEKNRGLLAPALVTEAMLARGELALLTGKATGSNESTATVISAAPASPSTRRLAFAAAAPVVMASVSALAGDLCGARASIDSTPVRRALAERARGKDPEAAAWLFFAERADPKGAPELPALARSLEDATHQSATPDVVRLAGAVAVLTSGSLGQNLWPDGHSPARIALDTYIALDPPPSSVEHLVAVASDRIALALARIPLAWRTAIVDASAAMGELERARRILAVAARRDPFAASVRRALASLALVKAELGFLASHETPSAPEILGEAAAAVLLAPYDRANLLVMARACVASGKLADATLWAERASAVAHRGDPADADLSLMETLRGIASAGPIDPVGASRQALIFALGGVPDDAVRRRFEETLAEKPPGLDATLDARGWAQAALAWDGIAVDRLFRSPEVKGTPPEDSADLLAMAAREAESTLHPLRSTELGGPVWIHFEALRKSRPDALAPRVYQALAAASLGSDDEAAEALDDVTRALEVARARGDAAGDSRLALVVQSLAKARLSDTRTYVAPPAGAGGEPVDVERVLERWKLHGLR